MMGKFQPFLLLLALASCSGRVSPGVHGELGSLEWTQETGGALSGSEKVAFILRAVPPLAIAVTRSVFSSAVPKLDPSFLIPPDSPIVTEAIARLRETTDPAFVNHSFRTAAWAITVMKHAKPALSSPEIEEAWIAGLLHDIGLALPPANGEFTLGGVKEVSRLAAKYGWSRESERKASEAITINPNSSVDRGKYGLLAWAMNVGGFGETFYGPYRGLMNPENIRELEERYPRLGLKKRSTEIIDQELKRFPNQRFGLLRAIGFLKLTRRDE